MPTAIKTQVEAGLSWEHFCRTNSAENVQPLDKADNCKKPTEDFNLKTAGAKKKAPLQIFERGFLF